MFASEGAEARNTAAFTIKRNQEAGAGYKTITVSPSPPYQAVVALGFITSGGPASQAGMGPEHVGWIITHVNGQEVSAETCQAALDGTRAPGEVFTMSVRRPMTGEFTIEQDANGEIHSMRHVDEDDIRVSFQQSGSNGTQVTVELAPALSEMIREERGSLEQVPLTIQQHIIEIIRETRTSLTPEQTRQVEEEESMAAERDIDAVDENSNCVVCLTQQRVMVLQPCHHLVTCHRCTVMLRRLGKCPLCRSPISDVRVQSELPEGEVVYNIAGTPAGPPSQACEGRTAAAAAPAAMQDTGSPAPAPSGGSDASWRELPDGSCPEFGPL